MTTGPASRDDGFPPQVPRSLRLGPRTRTGKPRRPAAPASQARRLAEWHQMSPGERHVAWSQLRTWVTWLHDRYELGVEDRLPRCWPQHPGLVEELWALKAWREEIYEAGQPSGQAARYWHTELRQVIQAATAVYAAGCRTGHRGARTSAADDARLQQRWATASPLAGIPGLYLDAARQDRPGHWLSQAAMAEALDNGSAQPLSASLPDHIYCAGTWWRPGPGGWARVTEAGLTAQLGVWAAQLARADTHASGRPTGQAVPEREADQLADATLPGHSASCGRLDDGRK